MSTVYISVVEINKLQTDIMKYVDVWVHTEKGPIPQRQIILKMKSDGVLECTTVNALNALLRKGYLRRAYTISNRTFYVALRRVA